MKGAPLERLVKIVAITTALGAGYASCNDIGPFADPTKEEIAETARVTEKAAHTAEVEAVRTSEAERVKKLQDDFSSFLDAEGKKLNSGGSNGGADVGAVNDTVEDPKPEPDKTSDGTVQPTMDQ